jgi:hypothetical protein
MTRRFPCGREAASLRAPNPIAPTPVLFSFVAVILSLAFAAGPSSSQQASPDASRPSDPNVVQEGSREGDPAIGDPDGNPQPSAIGQFTTGIEDREPIDQVTFVPNEIRTVFFFSDLRGLAGQTVTHRWSHGGQVVSEVSFEVGGPRWRVWSSKDLQPDWIGDWTVEIVTEDGEVLAAETFSYEPPDA